MGTQESTPPKRRLGIQARLTLLFAVLIVLGITTIASYSILFIRNYLIAEGRAQLARDAELLSLAMASLPPADDPQLGTELHTLELAAGYRLAVYGTTGRLVYPLPAPAGVPGAFPQEGGITTSPDGEDLLAYRALPPASGLGGLRLAVQQARLYAPIRRIRWIIYTGMFLSLILVGVVSTLFARSVTRPLRRLEANAQRIRAGSEEPPLRLARKDELGSLAASFAELTEHLRAVAEQHRTTAEKLSETNWRMQNFYRDIAHEVRNPVHTLGGALELLQLPDLPPEEKQRALQTAELQQRRLARLFEDLLLLQQIDENEHYPQPATHRVRIIASQAHQRLSPAKQAHVTLKGPAGLTVSADAFRIGQVLDNLLSNAFKYGAPPIELGWAPTPDEGPIDIWVHDQGAGIPEEVQPYVFDRFYRAEASRTREGNEATGSGLGLAIAQRIVQAHGYDIRLESRPGFGTRFSFQLFRSYPPDDEPLPGPA